MAKKSAKQEAKKKDAEKEARAKAAKRAKVRAQSLADEAKQLRRTADKASKKAGKAERKAADARADAGLPAPAAKPDEAELLKLALRSAEAKLVDAEHRARLLEQELDGERRLQDEEVEEALEDAVVEAAVEATVADAVADTVVEAQLEGDVVSDAELVEAIAVELDDSASDAEAVDDGPTFEGDAEASAGVFAATDAGAEPGLVPSELTPPLPGAVPAEEPSATWTLLRLRQEAKRRDLTGTSNLPKAALLERLRTS